MYTIYASKLAAQQANIAAAAAAGHDLITTVFLWECIVHPTDGRAALADGTGATTQEDMVTEGFLPVPTPSEE